MKGGEPVPYLERIFGVSVCRLVPNHVEIGLGNGWQDAIKGSFDVGTGPHRARNGFRSTFRVRLHGQTHFVERRVKLSLSQQKIAVSPGDFGGERINLLGVQKSVTR